MGGVVKINPRAGGGSANAEYITRTAAVEGGAVYHNAPEEVEGAATWAETRVRMKSWAETTAAEEQDEGRRPEGEPIRE